MIYQAKYGVAKKITFPLIDFSGTSFLQSGIIFSAGDTRISKDSGTFVNTSGVTTVIARGIYAIDLGITAMQAARIDISIIDSSTTKLWHDQHIKIETYGALSGEHEFDLDASAGFAYSVNAQLRKSVAFTGFPFVMIDNSLGTPKAGLTVTTQVSKDGAAFINADATATEIGSGLYNCTFTSNDLSANSVAVKFEGTGAKSSIITILTNNI